MFCLPLISVEEETTALSVSSTDHTSLSSRPRGGSPPGEVSTGCVNTEEEERQGDDGKWLCCGVVQWNPLTTKLKGLVKSAHFIRILCFENNYEY